MADVETTKEQRVAYITNNFRNAFNQLSRTGLSEEEILNIIIKKSMFKKVAIFFMIIRLFDNVSFVFQQAYAIT